jgi:hypothetical protein
MRILTKILKRKKKLDAVLIETTGRWPMALCSSHGAEVLVEDWVEVLHLGGAPLPRLLVRFVADREGHVAAKLLKLVGWLVGWVATVMEQRVCGESRKWRMGDLSRPTRQCLK